MLNKPNTTALSSPIKLLPLGRPEGTVLEKTSKRKRNALVFCSIFFNVAIDDQCDLSPPPNLSEII